MAVPSRILYYFLRFAVRSTSTCHKYKRITMGQGSSSIGSAKEQAAPPSLQRKVGIKSGKPICCCCPDTKVPRDECVVRLGEENPDCMKLIEAHKECLRAEGFNVK